MPFDLNYYSTAYKGYMNRVFLFIQISAWYNLLADIMAYFEDSKEYATPLG